MNPQKIIQREKRWALPVSISAFAALILLIGAEMIARAITSGQGTGASLESIDAEGSTLVLSAVVRALGMLALAPPLLYLFEAAHARNPRVRRWVGIIVLLGPLLFAVQAIATGLGTTNAAKDYAAAKPALTTAAPASVETFIADLEEQPKSVDEALVFTEEDAVEVMGDDGKTFTLAVTGDQLAEVKAALDSAGVEDVGETDIGQPGDLAAARFVEDNEAVSAARSMLFPALLALIFAFLYPSLWAMRVGLLTRFFGSLGMAIGVSILVMGPLGAFAWVFALGFMILGTWPGGRPPAWAAGEQVPWPDGRFGAGPDESDRRDPSDPNVIDERPRGSAEPGTRRKRKQRYRDS